MNTPRMASIEVHPGCSAPPHDIPKASSGPATLYKPHQMARGGKQLPRAPRRRGCQHCIACAGLTQHSHSMTARSSNSKSAEWWPGGLASPSLYFHLRHRQLLHQQRCPARDGQQWRRQVHVTCTPSTLGARRRCLALFVLVPTSCTNVAQGDVTVRYLGETAIKLGAQHVTPDGPASAPAFGAGRVTRTDSAPRRTWPHAPAPPAADMDQQSDRRHSIACLGPTEPKRSRTASYNSLAAAVGEHAAQQLQVVLCCAQPSLPPPVRMSGGYSAVYPGMVLQHGSPSMGQSALGVATPPLVGQTGAPLSAASNSSSTVASWDCMPACSPPDQALAPFSAAPTVPEVATGMPVLLRCGGAPSDPALQQYLYRQYNIKAEQAFTCHQAVYRPEVQPQPGLHQEHAGSDWASYLRSLMGSLRPK